MQQHQIPRLYGRRWNAARLNYLGEHPWCVYCERMGMITKANVVDHKTPHRGDPTLFWDESNWQSLCQPCHDSVKQAQEKSGHLRGADLNGVPLDTEHHWNVAAS